MNLIKFGLILLSALVIGGCASKPALMPSADFAPIMPIPELKKEQVTGGIYSSGRGLFGDLRSYQPSKLKVGDILTVLLDESTQASRSNEVKTSRESENTVMNQALVNNVAGKLGIGPSLSTNIGPAGGAITSDGSGIAGQAARLTGSISAMVVEVFTNGNLMIVGEKQLALTEGSEFIRIKGIIRPADIQPDNTVLSNRIANAQISYRGSGELASSTKTPWGTELLYNLWPF
ncbi:MAG: hypothetical protein CMK36_00495 [Porticoccaceae bacterium]|nr:hypothetical protein [Porticoccaceae bacterium]|tara:strand:- start:2052 stop:2750 length:699 start_codon:yes stop_codon:yes gene_type:complete